MKTKTYLISELEQLTGLARRTIHFYVQKGLVPAPSGKGGPARYAEESLLRLQIIRVLQGSHLKLDGIREALDGMDSVQMRQMVSQAETGHKVWDNEALESWVAPATPVAPLSSNRNFSFARLGNLQTEEARPNLLTGIKRQQNQTGERWERFQVSDGIELNIREEHADKAQQLLQSLLRELKKTTVHGGVR